MTEIRVGSDFTTHAYVVTQRLCRRGCAPLWSVGALLPSPGTCLNGTIMNPSLFSIIPRKQRLGSWRKVGVLMLAAMVGLLAGARHALAQSAATKIVAITGGAPPNNDGRFRNTGLVLGSLNDQGKVAFAFNLVGTSKGTANDHAVFLGDGVSLREIAREGDSLPAGPGTIRTLHVSSGIPVNVLGQVALPVEVLENNLRDNRIYRSPGEMGPLQLIVRDGDPSPTGQGVLSPSVGAPVLNHRGQVAFRGAVLDTSNPSVAAGIFSGDGVEIRSLIAPNQRDDSAAFLVHPLGDQNLISFNNAGQAAVFAQIRMSPTSLAESALVIASNGTHVGVLLRVNQPVPDGSGSFSALASACLLNEAGDILTIANAVGAVDPFSGMYLIRAGALTEISRTGANAPDSRWRLKQYTGLDLNNRSQVAFSAHDLDGVSGGVFRGDGTRDGLRRLVSRNQDAPDGNGTFSMEQNLATIVDMNDTGQVLFHSGLRNTAGGSADNLGLFLFDDSLGLQTVVRKGDPILGSTILDIPLLGFRLNHRGDVAFQFALADGRVGVGIWSYDVFANNRAPEGTAFQATINAGSTLVFSSTNLLQDVSDPDGGVIRVAGVSSPTKQNRPISLSSFTQLYSYTPPVGFTGVDEFTYVVRDDAGASTTFIGLIHVVDPNQASIGPGLIVHVQEGESVRVLFDDILATIPDSERKPFTIGSMPATTAGGVALARVRTELRFLPNADLTRDHVDVPVLDKQGNPGFVRVTVVLPDSLSGFRMERGAVVFSITGSLGTWTAQRASTPEGPWTSIGSVTIALRRVSPGIHRRGSGCPSGTVCRGTAEFRDPNPPPGTAFYRMIR